MPDGAQNPSWWIYRGAGQPQATAPRLPPPPPWRSFTSKPSDRRLGQNPQAMAFQAEPEEISLVNLALYLRRPLLVTGRPGVGKSTLAYSVAYELGLGPVLRWPITSRSTLIDGLYQYDSIGRLHAASLRREADDRASGHAKTDPAGRGGPDPDDIGAYIRLGSLGTALLPSERPRALLVDEIDKSDIDLPNDLLNVFEDGEFVIPELARLKQQDVTVKTADDGTATLSGGRVQCTEFPFVVLTSNGEREFPKAFLRRCIRLTIPPPSEQRLARMVAAHLEPADPKVTAAMAELIATFVRRQGPEESELANDQLLNALLMAAAGLWDTEDGRRIIDTHLLRPLDDA